VRSIWPSVQGKILGFGAYVIVDVLSGRFSIENQRLDLGDRREPALSGNYPDSQALRGGTIA
jgi:hypothetical protein